MSDDDDLPPLFRGNRVCPSTPIGTVVDRWSCPGCERTVEMVHRPGRPRIHCSQACRQRMYRWRQRHRAHTVATAAWPPESARADSHDRGTHALRRSDDPLARRRDRRGREVTVCGLLARPNRNKQRPDDRSPFLPHGPWTCRACQALTQPRPAGLVPPGAMPPPWRPLPSGEPDPFAAQLRALDPEWPLNPRIRELLDGIWSTTPRVTLPPRRHPDSHRPEPAD